MSYSKAPTGAVEGKVPSMTSDAEDTAKSRSTLNSETWAWFWNLLDCFVLQQQAEPRADHREDERVGRNGRKSLRKLLQ